MEDAKPFKIRKVPVCKCGDSNATCPTCGEGYLEITLKGQIPHFKEEKVETKKVPVCDCGEEKQECSTCERGYLQAAMAGLIPKFKEVEVKGSQDTPKAKDDDKEKTEAKGEKQAPAEEAAAGLMMLVGFGS